MPRFRVVSRVIPAAALIALSSSSLFAQDSRRSLDLTVNGTGLSIGDSRRVTGLRINIRDTRLERVNGINATVLSPAKRSHGDVYGMALGLPMTGGRNLKGLSVGVLGIGAEESMTGIGLGGIGMGAGTELSGIFIAGVGIGGGGNIRGLAIGGVGAGAGGNAKGILVGGVGAGVGGDADGVIIGGVGGGVGGRFRGLALGGVGVGAGTSATGIMIGGIGVGSPRISGLAFGGAGVGGVSLSGIMLSVGTVQVADSGSLRGLGVSAFNEVKGHQSGLTLGVVNYARTLRGAQVGVINIVRDNPRGRRVLPLINWGKGTTR